MRVKQCCFLTNSSLSFRDFGVFLVSSTISLHCRLHFSLLRLWYSRDFVATSLCAASSSSNFPLSSSRARSSLCRISSLFPRELLLQVLAAIAVVRHARMQGHLWPMLLKPFTRGSRTTGTPCSFCTRLNSCTREERAFSS